MVRLIYIVVVYHSHANHITNLTFWKGGYTLSFHQTFTEWNTKAAGLNNSPLPGKSTYNVEHCNVSDYIFAHKEQQHSKSLQLHH